MRASPVTTEHDTIRPRNGKVPNWPTLFSGRIDPVTPVFGCSRYVDHGISRHFFPPCVRSPQSIQTPAGGLKLAILIPHLAEATISLTAIQTNMRCWMI